MVNGYYRFLSTRAWGSGNHVSADGTQRDTYERNLLAERHVRYGGFDGIAYYHISDLYIALFNHFIPCGAYEGVYILDRSTRTRATSSPTQCMPKPWTECIDRRPCVHPGHPADAAHSQLEAPRPLPVEQGHSLPAHR